MRLLAYAAAAGAALAAAGPAEASVVYTAIDPANQTVSKSSPLDLSIAGLTVQFRAKTFTTLGTFSSNPKFGKGSATPLPGIFLHGMSGGMYNLKLNSQINAALHFDGYSGDLFGRDSFGQFGKSNGYLGFKFSNIGGTHYGWIQIQTLLAPAYANTKAPDPYYKVVDWAYEDTKEFILAGDTGAAPVPEPSSFALLAMGAGGVALYRKRRQDKLKNQAA